MGEQILNRLNKNRYSNLRLVISIFVFQWVLMACATPTISKNIYSLPVQSLKVLDGNPIKNGALIGGKGLDYVLAMDCDDNGSFTLYGQTIKSFGESTDFMVVKTSPELDIQWAKTYGGRNKDTLYRASRTLDGGYLLLGKSKSLFYTPLPGERPQRPFIIKLAGAGNPQWSRLVNPGNKSLIGELVDFTQLQDGSFIFVGQSRVDSGHKYLWDTVAIKLDSHGKYIWGYIYRADEDTKAGRVAELGDGNILILEQTQKDGADSTVRNDLILLKINSDGQTQWSKVYQAGSEGMYIRDVVKHKDKLMLTGLLYTGQRHTFAVKLTREGDVIWAKSYKNIRDGVSIPMSATVLRDGRYLIVGRAGEKRLQPAEGDRYYRGEYGYALILDSKGQLDYATYIGGNRDEEIRAVSSLRGGGVCLALNTESFGATYSDILVARWNPGNPGSEIPHLYADNKLELRVKNQAIERSMVGIDFEQLPVGYLNEKSLTPVRVIPR